MAGPVILSTGLIENRAPSAGSERPVTSLVIKVENNEVTSSTTEGVPIVLLEAFTATPTGAGFGTQETYVLYQVSLTDVNQPNSTFTIDNVFANLDNFGVRCTVTSTGSTLNFLPTVTVFGNNIQNNMVASYGLSRVSTSPCGSPSCFWDEDPSNPIYTPATDAYYQTVRYDAVGFAPNGPFSFYKMWYDYQSAGGIAYASSPDGINWTFQTNVTGLVSTARHSRVLYDPNGFGIGQPYRIWYWDSAFTNLSSCISPPNVCMIRTANSVDGITWTSDTTIVQDPTNPLFAIPTPVGTPTYNAGSFGPADILYFPENPATLDLLNPMNNQYVLYYSIVTRNDPSGIQFEQLALAVSTDGINWSKAGPAVILPHGTSNDWDYYYSTVGAVVLKLSDNLYKMWYSGGLNQSYDGIGCATSTDGLNWVKNSTNPVFDVTNGTPWRNMRSYNPWVLFDSARFNGHGDAVCYKFWLTGSPKPTDKKSIGYALNILGG